MGVRQMKRKTKCGKCGQEYLKNSINWMGARK
jgi:predicted nucleic-acid-binding Zn-ribbon protein